MQTTAEPLPDSFTLYNPRMLLYNLAAFGFQSAPRIQVCNFCFYEKKELYEAHCTYFYLVKHLLSLCVLFHPVPLF